MTVFLGKSLKENWIKEMKNRDCLLEGEELLAAIRGGIESGIIPTGSDRSKYNNISLTAVLLTHVRKGLIGLTNMRVIFYMPKIFDRYEFEAYNLDQINSIQFTKGMRRGRIEIATINDNKTIKWVDNDEGKKIANMIQRLMVGSRSSMPDPINRLKMRFANGEISAQEFKEMKEILENN